MNVEWVRELCLSFPYATEQIQWHNHLVFKVGGKVFAIAALDPSAVWLTFKCSPEGFVELTERPNIIPAPYLARAKWAALETKDALASNELESCLRDSYDMVFSKLPGKVKGNLASGKSVRRSSVAKGKRRKTRKNKKPGKRRAR